MDINQLFNNELAKEASVEATGTPQTMAEERHALEQELANFQASSATNSGETLQLPDDDQQDPNSGAVPPPPPPPGAPTV